MTFDELITILEDSLGAGAPIYSGDNNISTRPSSVSGFKGDSRGGTDEALIVKTPHFINKCPRCGEISKCKCSNCKRIASTKLCNICAQIEQNIR